MALRRVAIIGCGSIGRRHARLMTRRKDLEVELCEPNPEILALALKEVGQVRIHDTFEDVLASRPEMIVIATPHHLHADQTIQALSSGAHVLCEKPMSDNLNDAQRMFAAAEKSDRVLTFGFQLHFQPGLQRIKRLIDSGELGTLLHVHCRVGSYITLVNSKSRYQAHLEGALLWDYVHQSDALYWWLRRKPRGLYMAAGQGGALSLQSNPNFLTLTLDYDEPLVATIHLNYVQMPERHVYEVVGDKAWATFDLNTARLRIGRREEQTETEEIFSTERDPWYVAEHQAFLDAVDRKRSPESPAADAILSMQITQAGLASWKSRQRIEL